jgi:hypothetical protein
MAVMFASLQNAGTTAATLHYGLPKTTLTGHLHSSWQYGPPGFGETPKTDPKVSFVYIALGQPVEVSPNAGVANDDPDADIEKNVRKVRLWCFEHPSCKILLHTPSTCSVTIEGQLHHGVAPLDFYDVTMDVEDIQVGRCTK